MIYPLKGQLKRVWKVKFGTKEPGRLLDPIC